MEKEIKIRVMFNKRDGFTYQVEHSLIPKLFDANAKKNDVTRPVKRDDIGHVLGRIAKRMMTKRRRSMK